MSRPAHVARLSSLGLVVGLAVASAWGCSSGPTNDANDVDESVSQDELILRRGSVDHAAIVEATTMMLAGQPTDLILDPFNQEDPFKIRSAPYAPTYTRRLAQFDDYDNRTDWRPEQAAAWVARVSTGNYQLIDTSKPCNFGDPHTYLEIERAHMTGREHTTCGGRMPNEDALDVTLNFLIRGPAASAQDPDAITDGVDQPTKWSVDTFPYLAEMNGLF